MLAGGSAASDAVEEEEINELDEFGEDLSEASGGEAGPENAAVETEGGSRLSLEARVLNLCHALGGFERETNADGTTDGSSKWTYVLGDECLGRTYKSRATAGYSTGVRLQTVLETLNGFCDATIHSKIGRFSVFSAGSGF